MSQRSTAQHYHTDTPFCTIRKSHVTWNFAVPVPYSEEIRRCILLFLCTLDRAHTESERQSTSFVFHGGSWWEAWWSRWDNKLSHNAGTLRSTLPFSSILASRHSCSSLFLRFLMEVLFFSFFPHSPSLRFLFLRVFTHSCLGSVVAQTRLIFSFFVFFSLSFFLTRVLHTPPPRECRDSSTSPL